VSRKPTHLAKFARNVPVSPIQIQYSLLTFALSTKDVRGLDLSYSLISSWDVVALIVIELPCLERLFMKYVFTYVRAKHTIHRLGVSNNRLQPLSNSKLGRDAFSHLTELQLNGTLMSWQAIMDVVCLMPHLQRLESGYNRIQNLSSPPQTHPGSVITTLNLDSNQLSNWVETCQALVSFPKCSYHLKMCPLH
jgi:tubulin-specific chaperone E